MFIVLTASRQEIITLPAGAFNIFFYFVKDLMSQFYLGKLIIILLHVSLTTML